MFALWLAAVGALGVATVTAATFRYPALAVLTCYALFVVGPDTFAFMTAALAVVGFVLSDARY